MVTIGKDAVKSARTFKGKATNEGEESTTSRKYDYSRPFTAGEHDAVVIWAETVATKKEKTAAEAEGRDAEINAIKLGFGFEGPEGGVRVDTIIPYSVEWRLGQMLSSIDPILADKIEAGTTEFTITDESIRHFNGKALRIVVEERFYGEGNSRVAPNVTKLLPARVVGGSVPASTSTANVGAVADEDLPF